MTPVESAVGLPAPFWFIELFKILGFILHSIPMHIWLVGLPLAVLLLLIGGQNAKRFSWRLFKQFPIIIAFGINLGIVPLLFIQAAYYKAFYPSTVLIAVHWLAILALVMTAYYLLYGCSFSIATPKKRLTIFMGTIASCCLIASGLIFSSAWTLMASSSDWMTLWEKTSIGGAVSGLGTYWNNPIVYYRFGSIVGLAFLTLAFWTVFDSFALCRKLPPLIQPIRSKRPQKSAQSVNTQTEPKTVDSSLAKMSKKEKRRAFKNGTITKEEFDAIEDESVNEESSINAGTLTSYRNWTLSLASSLAWIGLLIAAPTLYLYFNQTIPDQATTLSEQLGDHSFYRAIGNSWSLLRWGTLISLVLPPLLLLIGKRFFYRSLLLFFLIIAEFALLAFFATTRQVIQNLQLLDYLNVVQFDSPSTVQWNPLFCFLAFFGIGLLIICWMIRQMVVASRNTND